MTQRQMFDPLDPKKRPAAGDGCGRLLPPAPDPASASQIALGYAQAIEAAWTALVAHRRSLMRLYDDDSFALVLVDGCMNRVRTAWQSSPNGRIAAALVREKSQERQHGEA